jgi:hypothetical protein
MMSIFLILLIIAVGLFVVQKWNTDDPKNVRCGQKLEEKRLRLGEFETKHTKCRLDIKNLQTGIDNPPPQQTFGYYGDGFYGDSDNCLKLQEINKNIELMKRSMEDCGKLRKYKIKELRSVIEKNGKLTDSDFKEILKKFNIS